MAITVTITPDELERWRTSLGMDQRQLADHLGVTDGTVSNWEVGRHPVTRRAVVQILQLAENWGVEPPSTKEA